MTNTPALFSRIANLRRATRHAEVIAAEVTALLPEVVCAPLNMIELGELYTAWFADALVAYKYAAQCDGRFGEARAMYNNNAEARKAFEIGYRIGGNGELTLHLVNATGDQFTAYAFGGVIVECSWARTGPKLATSRYSVHPPDLTDCTVYEALHYGFRLL